MANSSLNILVIKHGAFGDLIQSEGVLHDIRAHFTEAKISLLTTPAFVDLISRCPHIDQILTDPRAPFWKLIQQFQLAKKLKSSNFDLVIDLQNSSRTKLYRHLLFSKSEWVGRLKGPKPETGLSGQKSLLEQAKIATNYSYQPNLNWMVANISQLLLDNNISKPYIALIPGCSAKHPEKRWPYYSELATKLIALGYEVVNILGPDETELANKLLGHTKLKKDGYLTWFELAGILKQAAFVVGNDTGPSHVASCLGVTGLALFGSHTSAHRAEIVRPPFNVIESNSLDDISVDEVLNSIVKSTPL